jgi:PAS domain S-box-containing protein
MKPTRRPPAKRKRARPEQELAELRARLAEAEEALDAIRSGEVDAVVAAGGRGGRIYMLQGADESYRVFLQTMHEGAATLSRDGLVTYCNPAFARLVGAPAERVLGVPFARLVAEPDRARLPALLGKRRKARQDEIELQRPDGTRSPVLVAAAPLPLGESGAVCLVATDLAERRRAERELAEAHERLAITLGSIADAVIATDETGRVAALNPVAEQLTGWPLARARGRLLDEVLRLVDEDTRKPVPGPAARILKEGVVVGLGNHTGLVARDGTVRPIADSGAPIRDLSGKIRGVVVVFRDQTAQRRAARAEERLNRALRTLSECNEAVVRAADEQELLDSICRIIVETAGYRAAVIGFAERDEAKTIRLAAQTGLEELQQALPPSSWADGELGRGPTATAIRTGAPQVVQAPFADKRLARSRKLMAGLDRGAIVALPLRHEDHAIGALTILSDDPEAFSAEELRLLGELAEDVSFGIANLRSRAERRRLEAQLMVADRMVSMGTLAAGVAHEINNPLAYVTASLELMGRDLARVKQGLGDHAGAAEQALDHSLALLVQARDGAERVRVIVRDLKGFSRVDDERVGLVDVRHVVDTAINLVAADVKHRAQVVKKLGALPPVRANEGRLGQVFLNLLVNAAHAIPEGRVDDNEIRITGSADAGRVTIEVRDTGCGIAPEHVDRVFDPFFTTKPIGTGTGLGLHICRTIIGGLGGEISVQSAVGKGTAVTVTLPAARYEAEAAPPAPEGTLQATPGRRGRILVIDDEPLIGNAMTEALRDHAVTALTSARTALERLRQGERFDIIFCDLMMPDMTGMELYERIEEEMPAEVGKVVFLTGGAFTPRSRNLLDRVPNPALEKPFDLRQLTTLVRDRLR